MEARESAAPARHIDWGAAALAGVIGGAAFVGLELILDLLLVRGAFARQVRMTAAILLGDDVLPSVSGFHMGVILAAIGVHLAFSAAYGLILAWLILRLEVAAAEVVGLGFGLALYLVNFYGFSEIFPWFREERGWASILTHLVFGGVAAIEYKAFARRRKEMEG